MAVLTQDQIDLLKERMRNLGRGARGSKQIEALRNDPKIKKILNQLKGYSKDDNLSTADINIPPGFIERTRKVFGTSGDQLPGSKYRKAPKRKAPKRMTSQEADELFEKEIKLIEKSREPKTIGTAAIDKLKSVRRAFPPSQEALERSDVKMPSRRASSPSQEALERSEVKAPKKTRPKFLGLFEIDEKQPDFLEEMASRNKSGGSIRKKKMKKGGAVKVRKANCKRGQGKALRGY